jgi:hypothetical protein
MGFNVIYIVIKLGAIMKKTNYLNNKDILKEIHKSKNSFCSYVDPEFSNYDIIVNSTTEINEEIVKEAIYNREKKLCGEKYDENKLNGIKTKQDECWPVAGSISTTDVVFRVMTFDHIPDDLFKKKTPKTIADRKAKVNFPPFQHWKYNEEGTLICVGKSHWVGGLANGHFSIDHGKATQKLALMWMKLVERYSTRGNVRNYSYNDEMRGQAIVQLSQIGLQFNEAKSNNPFSYYTAVITNSFVKVINSEKQNQVIRDQILEMNGLDPSHSRLHDAEWEAAVKRNQ